MRQGLEVEASDLFRVVECLAHAIGLRMVLAEDPQVQLLRPPVLICRASNSLVSGP